MRYFVAENERKGDKFFQFNTFLSFPSFRLLILSHFSLEKVQNLLELLC